MRKTYTILCLLLVISFSSTIKAATDDCAMSVDMWLIGESCIISGIKLQSAQTEALFYIHSGGGRAAEFETQFTASPIGLASKPTELGWFYSRVFFDFTPMRSQTIPVEQSLSSENFVFLTSFLTEEQIQSHGYESDTIDVSVEVAYENFAFGYMFSTASRFLRLAVGAGVSYQKTVFDIFVCNNCNNFPTRVYQHEKTYLGIVSYFGLSLWESESLTIMQARLARNTKIIIYEDKESKYGDIETESKPEYTHFTFFSWSYNF